MNERIVILGAGESGTGAALLAKTKGYDIFVSDQGVIKEKYKNELLSNKIEFEEGKHSEDKILSAHTIIKSPGIADKSAIIKKAKSAAIPVIDEIEFAFQFLKGKIIAITGTNGKTTTTLLTYHLLCEAGINVALAGNVGESLAKKVAHGQHDWYVVEVSSFQLDGTKTFRPDIGILLNITPDHLDRYEYQMQNYIDSKFKLVQKMLPADQFIYYSDDQVIAKEVANRKIIPATLAISLKNDSASAYYDGREMQFSIGKNKFSVAQQDTTLKGPHNLINTMCAVTAASLAGASFDQVRIALKTFKNAPHRLESVGVINGVEFVNDSKATNVDSVVYALGSYNGPLVWIAGGIDKGNDYKMIEEAVKKKVRTLICLGKDNSKLHQAFDDVVKEIYETQSVKELVRMALQSAKKGDVVLLSPACASFDLFKNYEDRGNQFREAVVELVREFESKGIKNSEYRA
ncbi:MAG: UDP-N-acetylmuramoyl-L-alanine--D-glutamate ligase [Cytophagales bacterium]|nr:UDP-N-acetylmuramoyl-L-alanine--D-glutamate ligase [Bacteroidota bacterium]MBS1980625.1 UDP-N-acetylmuramoyl-L-alanine--D-glutamate ligase [Bacteroidota bacterium]WHZ07947.1 MAG: UDP-N-acetylmuramoyl-L-alanine--D-glutamate ligase [Cytophagales bacterium]